MDVYNCLPELAGNERRALLDRAVECTIAELGFPKTHAEQLRVDASVDLRFVLTELALRQALAAQARGAEDARALDGL